MSEPAFCSKCMRIQPCIVIHGIAMLEWICDVCGSIADMDFDMEYLEEFDEITEEET